MKKRALITGITGSGGSYLAEFLLANTDVEVHGTSRWHSTSTYGTINNTINIANNIRLHECDLTDLSSVIRMMREIKPDYIFHLAAHANVGVSFKNPIAVLNNNINNTINLFEALRLLNLKPIVQYCGTSEVYGQVKPEDCPIKETNQLNPVNIYAVSKLSQEKIAMAYFHSYGIPVIVTRMFAYINPRRRDIFTSAFAIQIAKIEAGQQDVLYHGNLDSIRTMMDVREAMEAYWVAIQTCKSGEIYNISGSYIHSVGESLQMLINMSKVPITTKPLDTLFRPIDVTRQIPDISKFTETSQWKCKIKLEDSFKWLLDYCRQNYV